MVWAAALAVHGGALAAVVKDPAPKHVAANVVAAPSAMPWAPDALTPAQRARAVGPGASGANVLRAAVLLDRAHFSSGEIDGAYGGNLKQAICGFQKLKQLPVSGVVDAATWAALEADQAPVLAEYVISAQDAAGPYSVQPSAMAAKAKLPALGYANAAEALGERFHASPALLRRLNPGKMLNRAGQQILVPNVAAGAPLPKATTIMVGRADGTLTLLDASGTPFAQFPASTGSVHDPLPVGQWKVMGVARDPVYQFDPKLFWDAKPGEAKATLPAGPNNPVGVVWIELSKKHYGIHGTPEPANIGKTQSHGCIRLTNWDALAVAGAISRGATVLLQE